MPEQLVPTTDITHPCATHLPVLRMVLALLKPTKVLELGAGLFSTPEFLACPSVKKLVSVETDPEWVERIEEEITDKRLDLRFAKRAVEALPESLMDFDLILVDDSKNAEDRDASIRAVLTQEHPVVIVHDAENPAYHQALYLAENRVTFTLEEPWTAVCWQ